MKEISITERAHKVIRKIFSQRNNVNTLKCDPELTEIVDNFAFDEVLEVSDDYVKESTRILCILASTIAQLSKNTFRMYVDAALNVGVKPSEIREVVYQAVPFVGFSQIVCFLDIMNEVFANNDIRLPLNPHATVTKENRQEEGRKVMDQIFGKGNVDRYIASTSKGQEHITDYMQKFCYGDFYTRRGLTLQIRELMTFCFLTSMGGCEKQLKNHIQGCKNVTTTKTEMVAAVTAMLPYIGFPRSLNALDIINEVYGEED